MTEGSYADRYLALRDGTPMFLKLLRSNPSMFEAFGMQGFEMAPGKPEEAPAAEPEGAAEAAGADEDEHPWLRQMQEELAKTDPEREAAAARFDEAHDRQATPGDEDVWQSSELPGHAEPVAPEAETAVIPAADAPTEIQPEVLP